MEERRFRGRLSWSPRYERVQPRKTPRPRKKLGRGTVVSKMDAIARAPSCPEALPIFLDHIERRAGSSIWTNDPKPAALRICWVLWVSFRAGNCGVLSVPPALIVVQVPEESPIETRIFGGAENSVGAPCITGLLFLEQTILRDQDPAVAQSLRIRR